MAQDVTLDPTTTSGGAVIHTDELSSGAHVQRIKVGIGNPGVYSDVSAANPFPVTGTVAASIGNTVTVTGSVTAVATAALPVSVGNTVTIVGSVSDGAVVAALAPLSGTVSVSDGAVVAALGGTLIVSDGAVVSALSSVTTSGAFRVNLDSSNVALGGGTQYSVGTSGVASAGVGNLMMGTRDDVLSTLASGEGEAVGLRVDSTGALWVAAAPGDAETTDGATIHSAGVTRQVNVGFVAEPNTVSVGANTIGMAGMTSQRAIYVAIREDSVGIGGGTQYTEDAAAAADPVGNAVILVRDDAPGTLVSADGDNVAQRGTNYGAAFVQIVSSSGSFVDSFGGGTQYSVGTSGVASAGTGTLAMATRDDALSTLASGEGEAVGLRTDSTGALWVNNVGTAAQAVSDGAVVSLLSGTLVVSDGAVVAALGGTLTVDGSAVTQPVSIAGTVAVSDGAVVSALGGVLTVRVVGASSTIISDGGNSITVDAVSSLPVSVGGTALTALQLIDNPIVAHDAAATGATGVNMSGARASNSIEGITQVANADATRLTADLNGCLVTRNATTLEELVNYHDESVTTGSIVVSSGFAAGGSGIHNYITSVTVTNTSATNSYLQLRDGTSGAVLWTFPVPANGGATHNFNPPLKQPTANTALAWDARVAVTTMYISINGFQAQG